MIEVWNKSTLDNGDVFRNKAVMGSSGVAEQFIHMQMTRLEQANERLARGEPLKVVQREDWEPSN